MGSRHLQFAEQPIDETDRIQANRLLMEHEPLRIGNIKMQQTYFRLLPFGLRQHELVNSR